MQQYARTLFPRALLLVSGGLLLCLAAPGARANSGEIFGVGSRSGGMGDAAAAVARGPTAAFYNPAGLACGRHAEFHFSSLAYIGWLRVRDVSHELSNPYEFSLGLTVAIPFRGRLHKRIWLGLLLTAHPDIVARVIAHLPTDPFYPYFDNRTQRLAIFPGLAVRILDSEKRGRLTLGVGVNVFAGLDGVIVGQEGAARALETRVSMGLGGIFRLMAGARYSWRWLHIGAAYRQEFSMPFDVKSFNFVAGTDLDLNVFSEALYTPHTFVLGLAFTPKPPLTLALDVTYALWRLYRGPYVEVTSVLPLVGDLQGDLPQPDFSDAIGVKLGFEWVFRFKNKLQMPLRAGLGFESSPVPDQPGRTNMLDGHKVMISVGAGFDLGEIVGRRFWIDLHLRLHVLVPRTITKKIVVPGQECPASPSPVGPDEALGDEVPCDRTNDETLGLQLSNPGYPSLKASGYVLSGGFNVGVELW